MDILLQGEAIQQCEANAPFFISHLLAIGVDAAMFGGTPSGISRNDFAIPKASQLVDSIVFMKYVYSSVNSLIVLELYIAPATHSPCLVILCNIYTRSFISRRTIVILSASWQAYLSHHRDNNPNRQNVVFSFTLGHVPVGGRPRCSGCLPWLRVWQHVLPWSYQQWSIHHQGNLLHGCAHSAN